MAYQHRVIDDQLDALLPIMPAILLDGPKGVGKTATALQRATTTFRLDDPTRLQIVQASPELAMQQPGPVLFDEWQRMPAIWDAVKRAVDSQTGQEGPFLLTGSAYVPGVTTHSGAGRIHDWQGDVKSHWQTRHSIFRITLTRSWHRDFLESGASRKRHGKRSWIHT
jgi:DNA polymerase III delta prime subunit